MKIETEASGDGVLKITVPIESVEERFSLLFLADLHVDSKECDIFSLRKTLEKAKASGWTIIVLGDIFDAMQGKTDPRSSKGALKDRHLQSAYFNALIDEAFELLSPYRENVLMISYGNHELSILRHNEIDILRLLAERLGCFVGGYEGFVLLKFRTQRAKEGRTIYYSHGKRGHAPVTLGIIDHQRLQGWVDADVIITGDNHNQYYYENRKIGISRTGLVQTRRVIHLQIPSFLIRRFGHGYGAEKMLPPRPKGGWLLTYRYDSRHIKDSHTDPFPCEIAFVS